MYIQCPALGMREKRAKNKQRTEGVGSATGEIRGGHGASLRASKSAGALCIYVESITWPLIAVSSCEPRAAAIARALVQRKAPPLENTWTSVGCSVSTISSSFAAWLSGYICGSAQWAVKGSGDYHTQLTRVTPAPG